MAKNNGISPWMITFLRAGIGFIFLYHGYAKLFMPGGFAGTVNFFSNIGIALPKFAALLVSVVEFFGGIMILIGLLTRWTALALMLEMMVALFKVHVKQGFFITSQAYGFEYILLILTVLFVVMISGSGKLSVGKRFFKSKHLH